MGLTGVNAATFGWGVHPQSVRSNAMAPATVAFGRDAFIPTQPNRATPVQFGYDPMAITVGLIVGLSLLAIGQGVPVCFPQELDQDGNWVKKSWFGKRKKEKS